LLFLGGGSAGTGIAELISQAMALEGMDIREARGRNPLFDIMALSNVETVVKDGTVYKGGAVSEPRTGTAASRGQ
jgi:hypothetical protein